MGKRANQNTKQEVHQEMCKPQQFVKHLWLEFTVIESTSDLNPTNTGTQLDGSHFTGLWAETPKGSRLLLAVLVRLVEKHSEGIVEQKPCWQTEQPLERERERWRESH